MMLWNLFGVVSAMIWAYWTVYVLLGNDLSTFWQAMSASGMFIATIYALLSSGHES